MEIGEVDLKRDLTDIVAVHAKAFSRFFLTMMGPAFVEEYYRSVIEYPDSIFLVAREQERLLGFAAGFGRPSDFYTFYRSRKKCLIPKALFAILRRPTLLPRVLLNAQRISSVKGTDFEVELSSICASPEAAGAGAGRALLHSFINTARSRTFESIYLTTDADENERVINFYLKRGFRIERSLFHGNRKMYFCRLDLRDSS